MSMASRTAYSTWTPQKPTLLSGHYLRNRSTLDIGVLGYICIVEHKEHSPEVLSIPPGTPCILCQLIQVPSPNRRFLKGNEKALALRNGLRHRSVRSNAVVRCRVGSLAIQGVPCVLIRSLLILFFHLQLCVTTGVLHITCMNFSCHVHPILHFFLLRMLASVLISPPSTLILRYVSYVHVFYSTFWW